MHSRLSDIAGPLDADSRERLAQLKSMHLAAGSVLFRPGDEAKGFVLVRSGRIAVYLTGPNGREILLYAVEPGETCIQTTLGILGGSITRRGGCRDGRRDDRDPRAMFLDLMERSAGFRRFVFRAFADRMADVTRVLEQVAFVRIEERLAALLLERAEDDGVVRLTHQQIATLIGSAREVVSRRLETFAAKGLVDLDRGRVRLSSRERLRAVAMREMSESR